MYNNMYGPFIFVPYQDNPTDYPLYRNLERIRPPMDDLGLFTPEEALVNGNAFKSQYVPYKNYVPHLNKVSNERDEMLVQIATYANIAHDLQLYLDVYPNHKAIFEKYKEYSKMANDLTEEFEKKYGPLTGQSATFSNNQFSYILTPSPWMM